jgi:general secretion pathway protein K
MPAPTAQPKQQARRRGMRRVSAALRERERGVALLIVIIGIALLTVMATEFAYNSRVDLQLATNQRDSIRAYYLARSGVGLSRLVLKFQKQLDSTPMPNLGGLLQNLTGGAGAAPGAGGLAGLAGGAGGLPGAGGGAGASTMNIQLWKMARVDCHMLREMVKSDGVDPRDERPSASGAGSGKHGFDDEFPEVAQAQTKRSFGGFEGCFNSTISNEEEKINLNKLDAPQLTSQATVMTLMNLLGDKRFEFLFEREDSNRVKVTPQELLLSIRDWVDEDEVQSTLNTTGQGEPFLRGFSDENYNYDRYNPRYKAKNARMDSIDELYFVHGVNDRVMAAFRDRFTVYPDINARMNVNTDDPLLLYMAILSVADPARPDPRLQNPLFVEQLIKQIRTARMFSFMGMGVLDFVNVVASAGVPINESIKNNVNNNRWVSDKSQTFTIKSVGEAGSVSKTITAVVRLDDNNMGRLMYWREE